MAAEVQKQCRSSGGLGFVVLARDCALIGGVILPQLAARCHKVSCNINETGIG
jgi:hypothetical protein